MKIDSGQWQRTVIEGAAALAIEVTDDQARAMGAHARLLLEWNRATNLTAITDPMAVAVKHYVDSLAAVCWIGEAVRILEKAGRKFEFPVRWGADLQSEHERYLTEKVYHGGVVVTDYPVGLKAFYMRLNDDEKTVARLRFEAPRYVTPGGRAVADLPVRLTLVPVKLYLKDSLAKVAISLAKGKKLHDKRADMKAKTLDREAKQAMKNRDY